MKKVTKTTATVTRRFSSLLLVLILAFQLLNTCAFAASTQIQITQEGQVVDTLDGVNAEYKPGLDNTNTGIYSCAGYVNKYYSKVFNVNVSNLVWNQTPACGTRGYSFRQIKTSEARKGDIAYTSNSNKKPHWMIVKQLVNGNSVLVIEQNYKYSKYSDKDKSKKITYCDINRTVTPDKVFRLQKNGVDVNGQPSLWEQASQIDKLLFDADVYYALYDDLQKNIGYNTEKLYEHYVVYGRREGRIASLTFDPKYYLAIHPDLQKAYGNDYAKAYEHFKVHGLREGRRGSFIFSAKYYLNQYSDLKAAYGNNYQGALEHFQVYGIRESRNSSPDFRVNFYFEKNDDVAKSTGRDPKSAMTHFVKFCVIGNEKRVTC